MQSIFQRMQTAPKGTYNGMLHCAGGILKNEGPLAFYKVFFYFMDLFFLVLKQTLGYPHTPPWYWSVCLHPIWRT